MKFIFQTRLLSVLCGHSVFSFPPQRPMTSDFEGFSIPDFIHYIYFPILILLKEPVFPFLMFGAKHGNYLVPFLKHLWYDAVVDWGLSTRCQHSTTRLSRRRCLKPSISIQNITPNTGWIIYTSIPILYKHIKNSLFYQTDKHSMTKLRIPQLVMRILHEHRCQHVQIAYILFLNRCTINTSCLLYNDL